MSLRLLEFLPPGFGVRLTLEIPPENRNAYPLFIGTQRIGTTLQRLFPDSRASFWLLYASSIPDALPGTPHLAGRFRAEKPLAWDRVLRRLPTLTQQRMAVWIAPLTAFAPPRTTFPGWYRDLPTNTLFTFVWRPIGGWWYIVLSPDLSRVYIAALSRYEPLDRDAFLVEEAFSLPFARRRWDRNLLTALLETAFRLPPPSPLSLSSFPAATVRLSKTTVNFP
ncbi:MAG: hypothetical protein KM310_07025 [Clostridiales bacterium]|nr:hypothetical protein [Clostridiales bacterium]